MKLEEAIDVFVGGFCLTKSEAHPYIHAKQDGLWTMRDGPGRRNPRKIEIATTGLTPAETIERVRAQELGWHFLCHIHSVDDDYEAIRSGYKSLEYRALSTEGFFVHDLVEIPRFDTDPPVRLVTAQEELDSIPRQGSFRNKLIRNTRLYMAWDEKTDYGWVRSVPVGQSGWVSGLYVRSEFRKRGFGRGVMSAMLLSDKEHALQHSVLTASSDGARLYPHLGYRKIGILQMFCPIKRF